MANFRKYDLNSEGNQLVFSILRENGLLPYHIDDIDYIEEPVEPTKELVQEVRSWMEYAEEELEQELEEAMEAYKEELEEFKDAPSNGYTKGLLLDTISFKSKEVLIKIVAQRTSGDNERVLPLD